MTSGEPLQRLTTAAELVAAIARFLESDVREATSGQLNVGVTAAAYALRIVERELVDTGGADAREALAALGYASEAQLAAAIRYGDLDHRAEDVTACLRTLARDRLAVAHPGYDGE